MNKKSAKQFHAGVDVSQETLDVAARAATGVEQRMAQFANTGAGHRQLIKWLTKGGRSARVVLEATGVYSLDLALALDAARRIEVMVVNPRAARKFAEACLQRSSTDATMAVALREYAGRMEFVPWTPPSPQVREVRAIARRMAALTVEKSRELNRQHAAGATADTPAVVLNDVAVNVRHLQRRIDELERHALMLITADAELQPIYQHLLSVCGIADTTAIQLLGELLSPARRHERARVGCSQWPRRAPRHLRHFCPQSAPDLQAGRRQYTPDPLHAGLGRQSARAACPRFLRTALGCWQTASASACGDHAQAPARHLGDAQSQHRLGWSKVPQAPRGRLTMKRVSQGERVVLLAHQLSPAHAEEAPPE